MTYDVAGESTVHGSTWDGFWPKWDDSKDDSKDHPMSSSGYPPFLPT